ncbi:MAG: toll/interleukin-1 receptor domain-containing protein [Chloroflexi bacterium]|nr:toll/interleukin-1 receptor domain-containing protein [Chloroflexota bacterium]
MSRWLALVLSAGLLPVFKTDRINTWLLVRQQVLVQRIKWRENELAQRFIRKEEFAYDVFLSHASEDKDNVARPLAMALQEYGLRVWYDEFELKIGDNLVAKLNAGINGSRFGIIVLSKTFFAKQWTIHELDMLERLWVTENHILSQSGMKSPWRKSELSAPG